MKCNLPVLTPEQRKLNAQKAVETRKKHREEKEKIFKPFLELEKLNQIKIKLSDQIIELQKKHREIETEIQTKLYDRFGIGTTNANSIVLKYPVTRLQQIIKSLENGPKKAGEIIKSLGVSAQYVHLILCSRADIFERVSHGVYKLKSQVEQK